MKSIDIVKFGRHGKVVGFYIPVPDNDAEEVQRAIKQLAQMVEAVLAESGLSEEELAQALDLSHPECDASSR